MVQYMHFYVLVAIVSRVLAAGHCLNITIPITISARNGRFKLPTPTSEIEVTDFVLNHFRAGVNYTANILQDYTTTSGDYNISATYCTPQSGESKHLQVLTHGLGLNRHYWDFSYNGYNYSYVDQAIDKGYSVLYWDRLGVGESSHGHPIQEIQSWLEVSALHELTKMLRAGRLPGVRTEFKKIFHIGHSYGSVLTYALSAMHPHDPDGVILTGFTMEQSYLPWFGYACNFLPAKSNEAFSGFPDGYLTLSGAAAFQAVALAEHNFDPNIMSAAVSVAQPISVGELLSFSGAMSAANQFSGPVFVLDGDRDLPFCGGNCSSSTPNLAERVQHYFTRVTDFKAVVLPNTGHAINLEYTHTTAYKAIFDFLAKHQ